MQEYFLGEGATKRLAHLISGENVVLEVHEDHIQFRINNTTITMTFDPWRSGLAP